MGMTEQRKHDLLLELRPEGAEHDFAGCRLCTVKASKEEKVATEDQAIFTQEMHEQLLATAVEKATTEATASADAEVLSLNEKLATANQAHEETLEVIADLKREIAEAAETARLEVLEGERVAAVEAVVQFSNEQIAKRKESWAKMSEEDFDSYLEDIQTAAKADASAEPKAPRTVFDGTRATAGEEGTEGSVIRDFFSTGLTTASQS
jgi:hypothetical protein